MNELSDEARALFDAARPGHDPGEGERDRVRRAVALRLGLATATVATTATAATGLGAGAGATATANLSAATASASLGAATTAAGIGSGAAAVGPSGAGTAAVGAGTTATGAATTLVAALTHATIAKVVLGLALVGVAGAGIYTSVSRSHVPSTGVATPTASASAAHEREAPLGADAAAGPTGDTSARANHDNPGPAATTEPPSVDSPPDVGKRLPNVGRRFHERASNPVETTPPGDSLANEARALADAQLALQHGDGSRALALLDEQGRAFPAGALNEEREAARVLALCAAGRGDEARAAAKRFLRSSPRSPLANRVRAACPAQ